MSKMKFFVTLTNVRVRRKIESKHPLIEDKWLEWMLYELIVPIDRIAGVFKMEENCYIDSRVSMPFGYDEMIISEQD